MRISRRTLIISLLIGLFVLCGCAAIYFLSTLRLGAAAPPPLVEPGDTEPTQPPQLTAVAPEATEPPVFEPGDPEPTQPPALTAVAPEVTVQPAIPERRRLTLEFPPQIRAGDSDLVRLTLDVDDLGNLTPTAQLGGNIVTGEIVEIPNVYESHQVIAEARFDLAGMEVRPPDLVSEALTPGGSVTFQWSVRPQDVGFYRGTIWLYLRFVEKQSGEESRKTVSAQIVEIESVNFLGLSGEFARTTGIIGSVVGTIIGFPFFEDILKFLLKRRNKTK